MHALSINHDSRRLGLFLPLRLATYVILMLVVAVWMHYPQYLHFQSVVYSVLTLAFALCLWLERRYALHHVTIVLLSLQTLLEISVVSGVVFATGNVNSPFSALFVLTIVSAALFFRMVGTLLVASSVSLSYAFIIWLGLSHTNDSALSVQALKTIFSSNDAAFWGILLHILIFYLTAFISGYLAERLSHQDRKLADASVALKRARLETDEILRHLNSGLLTIDATGYIVYFNRAAERILGYSEEQVKGMRCGEVFAERMPGLADCLIEGFSSKRSYPRLELEIKSRHGDITPLGLSTSILTEEDGELRGVICIFSDLTDAKRLENKVRANDRLAAIGELSASIAHEIRNPLAAISGSVEVLSSELQLDGPNARLMELITRESQRLNKILTEFLAYARIGRPAYTKVELCHLVSEVRELIQMHDRVPDNIVIAVDSDEPIVYVVGDEDLIKQMVMNLLMNACEAFEGNPGELRVSIDSARDDAHVFLRVADNGPGIPEEYLDKVYEPFFSTKKQGTGLGLAIVHRVVTALKLKLHVESVEGQGTCFTIDFQRFTRERSENDNAPVATMRQ
ncbi:PAS domain S-box protein [candidate division GN15 bacterium]|nr:PAS domain S-box protein [candidate division GN15 bacterium]